MISQKREIGRKEKLFHKKRNKKKRKIISEERNKKKRKWFHKKEMRRKEKWYHPGDNSIPRSIKDFPPTSYKTFNFLSIENSLEKYMNYTKTNTL